MRLKVETACTVRLNRYLLFAVSLLRLVLVLVLVLILVLVLVVSVLLVLEPIAVLTIFSLRGHAGTSFHKARSILHQVMPEYTIE